MEIYNEIKSALWITDKVYPIMDGLYKYIHQLADDDKFSYDP